MASAQASPTAWPTIDWPRDVTLQLIADDMRFNGRPVKLHTFLARGSADAVAEQLRGALGASARVSRKDGRVIVGNLIGDVFVTVDLRPDGADGLRGYVMQTLLRPVASTPPPPMPADSTLRSHTETTDGPTSASMVFLENRHSVAANAGYYRDRFRAQGLKASRSSSPAATAAQASHVAEYTAAGRSVVVVIQDHGEFRTVTVHHLKESK